MPINFIWGKSADVWWNYRNGEQRFFCLRGISNRNISMIYKIYTYTWYLYRWQDLYKFLWLGIDPNLVNGEFWNEWGWCQWAGTCIGAASHSESVMTDVTDLFLNTHLLLLATLARLSSPISNHFFYIDGYDRTICTFYRKPERQIKWEGQVRDGHQFSAVQARVQ